MEIFATVVVGYVLSLKVSKVIDTLKTILGIHTNAIVDVDQPRAK